MIENNYDMDIELDESDIAYINMKLQMETKVLLTMLLKERLGDSFDKAYSEEIRKASEMMKSDLAALDKH